MKNRIRFLRVEMGWCPSPKPCSALKSRVYSQLFLRCCMCYTWIMFNILRLSFSEPSLAFFALVVTSCTSRSEQGNSHCASARSGSRSRGRRAKTRRSASSVRPRGLVKRRSAKNCPLGFNWRGQSPQLRTFRGRCEYRVQIVARTGCKSPNRLRSWHSNRSYLRPF